MYAFATSVIAMPNDGKPSSFYPESSGPMTTPPPPCARGPWERRGRLSEGIRLQRQSIKEVWVGLGVIG